MRTILIVDDEATIRLGLCTFVNELGGFHVIGECKNGVDALQKIMTIKPDIVITDIKMPLMDGITLIKESLKSPYMPKFIILSGYGEFEYAREAVRAGAYDYILKPVDHENFGMVLRALDNLIAEESRKKRIIKQQAGINLITGDAEGAEGLSLSKLHTVVVFDIDAFHSKKDADDVQDSQSLLKKSYEQMKKIFKSRNMVDSLLFLYNEKMVAIIETEQKAISGIKDENKDIASAIKKIVDLAVSSMKIRYFAGVGRTCIDVTQIQASYKEALSAIRGYLLDYETDTVWRFCDFDRTYNKDAIPFLDKLKKIPCVLLQTHPEQFDLCLDGIMEEIKDEKCHPDSVINVFTQFLMSTAEFCGLSADQPFEMLSKAKTCDEIKSKLKEHLYECCKYKSTRDEKQYGFIINEAIKHIHQHYSDSKLSLTYVCNTFHMDSSYFCRLFKSKTNKTFNEYLAGIRIEKSIELLSVADKRVYEISEMVGIADVKYFCKMFKKTTGYTPHEYRDKLIQ